MPKISIRSRVKETTRERILKAAILRFSTHSYEETGLRDLAADVGVDPAYVHRSFGSKEKLFSEALRAVLQPDRLFSGEREDIHTNLANELLTTKGRHEVRPLDIAIRSFSSPEASRVLRTILMDDVIAPLIKKQGDLSATRAALIMAFLGGVGILRDVIRADPLVKEDQRELERIIAQIIRELLTDGSNGDKDEALPCLTSDRSQ